MSSSMPTYDGGFDQKNKRRPVAPVLITVLLVAAIGMQLLLPIVTANRIAERIESEWGIGSRPNVTVRAIPFFKIWMGQFDELVIQGNQMNASGLEIEEWEMHLKDVSIREPAEGLHNFTFEEGNGYARVNELAIENYLKASTAGIIRPRVLVTEDYIFYSGQWEGSIINISFSVTGFPYVDDAGDIRLRIDRITVGPFDIPGMIRDITESFVIQFLPQDQGLFVEEFILTEIRLAEGSLQMFFIKDNSP